MFVCLQSECSFYDRSAPIYTQPRHLPPSKILDADVTDSVIGEGCVIKVSSVFFTAEYFTFLYALYISSKGFFAYFIC
jgi:ADP-glucose pyrophosphorylase